MTFALRRSFWMVDLGFIAGAAALCAAIVIALVPRYVRFPDLSLAFAAPARTSDAKTLLDAHAVSQVMGLPLGQGETEHVVAPAPTPSALSAKLLGTSVSNVPELSLATIQDLATRETGVFAVGDLLQGATVLEIERLRVTVDNQGRREIIDLEQSVASPTLGQAPVPALPPGVIAVGPGKFEIDRQILEAFIANPGAELAKMLFSPSLQGGVTRGWKLSRLAPDALLAKLGLAQGDVLRRVNGFELTDPTKLLETFTRLRDASRIELETERNGAPQRLEYRIRG